MVQETFGGRLADKAMRCWNLTAAVPEEHEAELWEHGDRLIRGAALFRDPEAERHVAAEDRRAADRSAWQREFWEIAEGF